MPDAFLFPKYWHWKVEENYDGENLCSTSSKIRCLDI